MKNKSLSGAMNVLNSLKPVEDYQSAISPTSNNSDLNKIPPSKIKNWKYHDRPETELGDIENLAKALKLEGQQQPCLVRPYKGENFKYELIIGQRRWLAAKKIGINLICIVKDIDDKEAAIAQAAENNNRKDLSEYAKSMNYLMLIDKGIIKQSELMQTLNISRMQFSRLMSFSKIPSKIKSSIGNMSCVSARTSSQIVQLAAKGKNYEEAIIKLSKKISSGKIGHNTLTRLVEKIVNENIIDVDDSSINMKISNQVNLIKLVKLDDSFDNNLAIYLPNEISTLISENQDISKNILSIIKKQLRKTLIDCNPGVITDKEDTL